jgi:hypothetical protein
MAAQAFLRWHLPDSEPSRLSCFPWHRQERIDRRPPEAGSLDWDLRAEASEL